MVQPLNSYVKASKFDTSAFFPKLLGAFESGKTIYGFPKDWSPLAMEVNKGLLGQAGGKAPTNWAQLLQGRPDDEDQEPHSGRRADLPLARLGAHARVRLPGRRLALEHQLAGGGRGRELLRRPAEEGPRPDADAARRRLVRHGARQGQVRDHLRGQLAAPVHEVDVPGSQYGIFPMVKDKTGGNLAFTVSYSMAKDSQNKQAAWTLSRWLVGKQGQTLWMSKGLALPSRNDVKAIGGRKNFLAAAPYAVGWGFGNPNFSTAYTVMNNDLTAVISGSKSVSSMLADIAAALKGG